MDVFTLKSEFPKSQKLKDGSTLNIREMTPGDKDQMIAYFAKFRDEDKIYFRMSVTSEGLDYWISREKDQTAITFLGFIGDELAGIVALYQELAASCEHVAYVRLSVSPDHRKKGVASILAHEINLSAFKLHFEKVCLEITPEQKSSQEIFSKKLGFKKEATLKNHIKDLKGKKHDLLIYSNSPSELLEELKRRTVFTDKLYSQEY